jgi:hypothetical protein
VIDTAVVLAVVALAAWSVLRRAWRLLGPRKDACGCAPRPGCPAARGLADRIQEAARNGPAR